VQCLAWWGTVQWSTIKYLHHWQGNIYQGIALLWYLNTFSEEISGVHSDRSLKYLSFFQRQHVVLSCILTDHFKFFVMFAEAIYGG